MQAGGAIVLANYDFRSSGTVAKSIQIAAAARSAGLPAELWAVRAEGPLLAQVPADVPVVQVGAAAVLASRPVDLLCSIPALARAVRARQPAVFLSGGNHFHLAARAGLVLSGLRQQVRLGLRASNSSRHCTGTLRPGAVGLTRLKYSGADFVAAVSGELAEEVRAELPGLAIDCIPNGCDLAAVRRLAREPFNHRFFDAGAPVITAMGRLAPQKGFDDLIRALALVRRHVDARLLVIGSGAPARRDALRSLAVQQGVGAQVELTGYLANPFAAIARSRLFVCASRWEGSCNALLEALACEVPVVATSCPAGNREIMLGGLLGEMAPPDCVPALADAMLRELGTQRPDAQRNAQLARLDIARCLDRWCTLLEREYRLACVAGALPQRA